LNREPLRDPDAAVADAYGKLALGLAGWADSDNQGGRVMEGGRKHYRELAIELVADGAIMFAVMYAMVDSAGELFFNTNNLYMTLAMLSPMGILMIWAMRHMFPDRRLNIGIAVALGLLFIASLFAIRVQAGVGDKQVLRAMIPHHSGAILMCREAEIEDAQIADLCRRIGEGQRQEIEEMKAILERL
jgi:hypothetical protein